MDYNPVAPLRKHHRRRVSAKQLSLDSLPGYPSSPTHLYHSDVPSELPPEYSADDADCEDEQQHITRPHLPSRPSSSRRPNFRSSSSTSIYSNKRGTTSESHLDSLLERSVQALEMSNVLLQSAMPHQHPFHSAYSQDHLVDNALQWSAQSLDHRIRGTRIEQESWMNQLRDLAASVEDLFQDGGVPHSSNQVHQGGLSVSLPAADAPALRSPRSRSATSTRIPNPGDSPGLRYSSEEQALRSPPPRALTQYVSVASSHQHDPLDAEESILLPSTLGLRSSSHISGLPPPSIPRIPKRRSYSHDFTRHSDRPLSETTTARELMSSLATLSSSPTSSRSSTAFTSPRRPSFTESPRLSSRSRDQSQHVSSRESSISRRSHSPHPSSERRPMTPPLEEPTPPSSASSLEAPQAMQSLRKILEEAPSKKDSPTLNRAKSPPPSLLTRSSPSQPLQVTTTASISRLLTKSTHHSSISAPAPGQSSLKPPSPLLPASSGGSTASSGRSTPRGKVQFAELPESYASTKDPGSKFMTKSKSKKSKKEEKQSWWKTFLVPPDGNAALAGGRGPRFEERIEDRAARGWTRPGFGVGSSVDDWSL